MALVNLTCDVMVAGGGMAGVCAAIAAARNGAKVVLAQDRSRLGGNASSEVKMHIVGANNHGGRPGWREGGLLEELRLDDAANNPQRCWELWDLLLYDKVISEPNITLLLDSSVYSADVEDGLIHRVSARCDRTEHIYRITAKLFVDCTGDSRLGLEAGASMKLGHESRAEFGESLAPRLPNQQTQGCSILFTSRDFAKPMPYTPPKWARKITAKNLRFRGVTSWEYGYWWIEWGGEMNTVRDNERIRFELLSIVTGVWDYIKNSGAFPATANWAMDWVGMLPGKREARRLVGDHMLTQHDVMGLNGDFDDAVCIGGWNLDEHPPSGFDDPEKPPFVSINLKDVYNIPLRSLYSKNVRNPRRASWGPVPSRVRLPAQPPRSVLVTAFCRALSMRIPHGERSFNKRCSATTRRSRGSGTTIPATSRSQHRSRLRRSTKPRGHETRSTAGSATCRVVGTTAGPRHSWMALHGFNLPGINLNRSARFRSLSTAASTAS